MNASSGIGRVIFVSSVEIPETVFILREVGRHPVEDHADAVLMKLIDQPHEVLRRSKPGCWSEVARNLISPGTVEGMLHHGKEFDVSEAHLLHVGDKLVC